MTYSMNASVCERDIDLLLLEEFVASLAFLQWFSGRVAVAPTKVEKLLEVQRSVIRSNGESDIEVLLQNSNCDTACLLIENKINALFQPQQAERYRSGGQDYQNKGKCGCFQTILVAPERYFSSDTALEGFDARVTYEEIKDWFTHQSWMGARQRYKVALLTAAIEKGVVGYQPIGDDSVTSFWYQYWQLSQAKTPALRMKEPVLKPAGAGFVLFKPSSLPSGVDLIHKLPHGNVDLQFSGMGHQLDQLQEQFGRLIDADMRFEKASKSACIRLQVPPVDTTREFDPQREASILGLDAATRLLRWYEKFGQATALDEEATCRIHP